MFGKLPQLFTDSAMSQGDAPKSLCWVRLLSLLSVSLETVPKSLLHGMFPGAFGQLLFFPFCLTQSLHVFLVMCWLGIGYFVIADVYPAVLSSGVCYIFSVHLFIYCTCWQHKHIVSWESELGFFHPVIVNPRQLASIKKEFNKYVRVESVVQ